MGGEKKKNRAWSSRSEEVTSYRLGCERPSDIDG
jgi:hypothetical protein